jgi:hypothetical protein
MNKLFMILCGSLVFAALIGALFHDPKDIEHAYRMFALLGCAGLFAIAAAIAQ